MNEEQRNISKDSYIMYHLTNNEVIQTIWKFRQEYNDEKILPFVIRGNLLWESEGAISSISDNNSIWLKSNYIDLDGKSLRDYGFEFYTQTTLNSYEIWGGISFECRFENINKAKEYIQDRISDITLLRDIISLLIVQHLFCKSSQVIHSN